MKACKHWQVSDKRLIANVQPDCYKTRIRKVQNVEDIREIQHNEGSVSKEMVWNGGELL
jgi:hypothetical protein